MRNLKRQITAVLTAAVLIFSAAGTASAQENRQGEAPQYTGWVTNGGSWQYLADGEPYNSKPHKIDGVMCNFSYNGYYIGGYSGWENDRCYENGFPYTGWTDNRRLREMREEYYCIDGYKVTGDFPVEDRIYSFTKTGKYTGKSRDAGVVVFCGEKISADTEKITFTIENLNNESHKFKVAKSFEYLKNGEWVSCKNGKVSYYALENGLSKKGEKLSFEADVSECSRNKFNEGFYRLPIICGGETYYAVFEAVAPIELKSRKDEYVFANNVKTSGSTIQLDLTINSDKKDMQTGSIANSISVKLEKQTENGWTELEDIPPCMIASEDGENRIEIVPELSPREGYYRATVTVGKNSCTDTFRIRNHAAAAWLDGYDLNSKELTVSFTVINCGDEPIEICTFLYGLYKRENGEWKYIDNLTEFEISSDAYMTLKNGKSAAVNFELSKLYNLSELTAGEYAVDIGGIGLAEFTLTDKPAEKNLPFKDLKAQDVKEIIIADNACDFTQKAVISSGSKETKVTDVTDKSGCREITASARNSEYLNRSITYLRQFEVKEIYKNYDDSYVGGSSSITVVYKDGTKTELFFYTSEAVRLGGKWYHCGEYAEPACMAAVKELAARKLPFEDIYENEPVQIQLKNIDGGRVITAELNKDNGDFHSQVVYTYYFELKDVCENYEMPTGGAFQITFVYKDGSKMRLAFLEPDIVLMPDGKFYRCYSSSYYDGLLEIFGKLEHSVSNIEPDYTLPEDPIEVEQN